MSAIALPLLHPGLLIISWMMFEMSGVCSVAPAFPTVVHGAGFHAIFAIVRDRELTSKGVVVNGAALSLSSPSMDFEPARLPTTLPARGLVHSCVPVPPLGRICALRSNERCCLYSDSCDGWVC